MKQHKKKNGTGWGACWAAFAALYYLPVRIASDWLRSIAVGAAFMLLSMMVPTVYWQHSQLSLSSPQAHADNLTYSYDSSGHVIQAINTSTGAVVLYQYDAVGNIVLQRTTTLTDLTISNVWPLQAPVGSSITITGTGFSTTPSANTVTINDTAATVTSASITQLIVTIPAAATSGLVRVILGSRIATYQSAFTVTTASSTLAAPTISSFSPTSAASGSAVTLTGTNFLTTPSLDKVLFNGTAASITAATNTTLTVVVPTNVASGPIQVITPYGSATSSSDFIVPPSGYATNDVVATGRTTENGSTLSLNASIASKPVIALFNGTQGDQYVRVAVQGGSNTTVQVINPHGVVIASGSSPALIDLPTLKETGTYSVSAIPSASATIKVTASTPLMQDANLSWSGETAATPSSSPYTYAWINTTTTRRVFLTFAGTANQLTQMDLSSVNGTWTASLMNSTGSTLWTSSSLSAATSLSIPALPADGNYTLVFDPGWIGSSVGYVAGIVAPSALTVGSTVTVNGGPYISGNGPTARVLFSGTAGQYLTLSVGAVKGYYYGLNKYYVSGTSQACLGTCGTGGSGGTSPYLLGPLPNTGTYVFYMSFYSGYPSTATAALWGSTALTVGSSATVVPFDLGDLAFRAITFSTSGGYVSFHATPTSCFGSWKLLNSSGSTVNTATSVTSGLASLGSLASGAYTLVLSDAAAFYGSTSGNWSPNIVNCSLQLTSP